MHIPKRYALLCNTEIFQLKMLSDLTRIDRYKAAVAALVRPGDVVADVGCGSGLLGRLCLDQGAAKVYMIDVSERSLDVARYLGAIYHPGADIDYIAGDAKSLTLGEKVDLVVSDIVGTFGDDEGMSETLPAFCRNNAKPAARLCPVRVTVHGALCRWHSSSELPELLEPQRPLVDYAASEFTCYRETDPATISLCHAPVVLADFDGTATNRLPASWTFPAVPSGCPCTAIAVWVRVELARGIVIDAGPAGERTMWCIGVFTPPAALAGTLGRAPLTVTPMFQADSKVTLRLDA